MTGILIPLLIATIPNTWIQDLRNWRSEQERTPIEEMLNTAEMEYEHGCDGSTEQE